MTRRVITSREAEGDLLRLYDTSRSGAALPALWPCVGRIRRHCAGFGRFPDRGTERDDVWPGLRTVGFERRVTIAFTVAPDAVMILRVLYGGRDLEAAFGAGRVVQTDPADLPDKARTPPPGAEREPRPASGKPPSTACMDIDDIARKAMGVETDHLERR